MEAEPPESFPTQASDSSGARPAAFASDRAASLRAMFPARPGTATPSAIPQAIPQAIPAPPLAPTGGGMPRATRPHEPAPARGIGRRLLGLVIAVVLVLLAIGVVANGIRRRVVEPAPSPAAQGGGGLAPAGEVSASPQISGSAAAPVVPASAPVAQGSPAVRPAPAHSKSAPAAAATTTKAAGTTATRAASGPLAAYSACHTSSNAVYAVTFTATFSWHHVFIDTDATTATGYRVPEVSLGADYMVEDGTLYRSTGTKWGWSAIGGTSPLVSHAGGTYHWQVALSAVGDPGETLRSVFNGSSGSAEAYSPVLTVGAC